MDIEWLVDVCNIMVAKDVRASSRRLSKGISELVQLVGTNPNHTTWEQIIEAVPGQPPASRRNSANKRRFRLIDEIVRAMATVPAEELFEANMLRTEACVRQLLTLARVLRANGRVESSRKTLMRAAELCTQYQTTALHVCVVQELIDLAALLNEAKELSQHQQSLQELIRRRALEDEVRMLEAQVRLTIHQYASDPPTHTAFLQTAIGRMREIDLQAPTFLVRLTRYRVELYAYSLLGDPQAMLQVSTAAMNWLDDHPDAYARTHMAEFLGSRMSAAFLLNDFDAATAMWPTIQSTADPGSSNWSGILQLYFLVCTNSGNLEDARDVVALYRRTRMAKGLPWREQMWEIYHAYILLLIQHGVIPAGDLPGEKTIYVKNLEKKCADVIRDKPQMNVLILILHVFQWLVAGNYSRIIDSAENLRVYASRYLKTRQTQRTGLFLRKLGTLPASDFDPDVAQARAAALHTKYANADTLLRDDAEIIPYNTLWSLILKILRDNAAEGRRRR